MKKAISLLLCIMFVFALVSCGADNNNKSGGTTAATSAVETSASASDIPSSESEAETSATEKELSAEDFEKFDETGKYIPTNFDTMKIMKLTQWDVSEANLYVSSGVQRSEASFKVQADRMMKNIADAGYNTVLMQLRPFADSFYPSDYYPLSTFVSGSYANQHLNYDPIKTMVEKAHKYGLSIHGWINPMRCMTVNEIEQITGDYEILKWYKEYGKDGSEYAQYMFIETDAGGTTRLYLNPAYKEVRDLIISGVREICDNYKVDGIFMDDYFYPSGVLNKAEIDSMAYESRTDGSGTTFQFRCNNVTELVKGIYSTVKESNPNLIYGISPNGELKTAYNYECADAYTWCAGEGYIDIIYPQFYYGMLHKASAITSLLIEWDNAIKNDNIKLVPILTLHKSGNTDQWAVSEIGKSEWIDHNDVILEELTYLMTNSDASIDGIGFFCYQYFWLSESKSPAVQNELKNFSFIIYEFEKYNGKSLSDLKQFYADNGIDLDKKAAEWNESLDEAGKDILF